MGNVIRRAARGVAVAFAAVACALAVAAEKPRPGAVDPGRVSWSRLEYTARKIGETATIVVSVREVPVAQASQQWLAVSVGEPIVPSGDTVVLIESRTSLLWRTYDDRLWLDGAGSAIQIDDTATGHTVHSRTYRLCRAGVAIEERVPEAKEDALPPSQWSRVTRSWRAFPAELATGRAVTGPMGLLWSAGAVPGMRAADALELPVLVQGQIEEVVLRMEEPAAADVDFVAEKAGSETRVRGLIGVMRASMKASPLAESDGSHFRVFGLEGDIQVLWDQERGLPVEISGEVRLLGHLVIRLTRATLR